MPSQVSAADADQGLGLVADELKRELERRTRELAEAREQQAATAGILAATSRSPTDLQRVFAEIAASAARLCDAYDATILKVDGDALRIVVHHGSIPPAPAERNFLPLIRGVLTGRSVLERRTIQVEDLQTETDEYPEGSALARNLGHRTILAVPLIHAGEALGAISVRRTEIKPFVDNQIALLQTFADQAVIAIENLRLFEAEQTRTRELTERTQELTETLAYQTAISDVLSVISRSPSNLQPVLDAIVETAARLCRAVSMAMQQSDGRLICLPSQQGRCCETTAFKRKELFLLFARRSFGNTFGTIEPEIVKLASQRAFAAIHYSQLGIVT
jgi:two-component system, NtrC family, sensor kinase